MFLKQWMRENRLTLLDVGVLVDREHTLVSRYVTGQAVPTAEVMASLNLVSQGAVRPADFIPNARKLFPHTLHMAQVLEELERASKGKTTILTLTPAERIPQAAYLFASRGIVMGRVSGVEA